MRRVCSVILAAGAIVGGASLASAKSALYQWVQYVPGGTEARAVVADSACPTVLIDGAPHRMSVRAAPGADFPVTVCKLMLPPGAQSASIDGAPLPAPKTDPARVLLIGDTGCRITMLVNQSCNVPDDWPFSEGASIESAMRPDLVVHVGDFHYRESSCRPSNKGCAGSPHGDSWAVWEADFFNPAGPLLKVAPFIFARGNHEECERGGKGWSRLLDPYPLVSATGCLGLGAPFVADIGSPKIVVMDVSTASQLRVNPKEAEAFRKQFASIATLAPTGPVWVVFHRPVWAAAATAFGFVVGDNKTLAAAARGSIPANVGMLLSGHIHTFQALSYQEDLPMQIVSGHGGDELHTTAPSDPTGLVINGVHVKKGVGASGVFGFVMLNRDGERWRMTNHDMSGKPLQSCLISGRSLACD